MDSVSIVSSTSGTRHLATAAIFTAAADPTQPATRTAPALADSTARWFGCRASRAPVSMVDGRERAPTSGRLEIAVDRVDGPLLTRGLVPSNG